MTLSIFRNIQTANVNDSIIGYRWDDWNVEQAEEPIDEKFLTRLRRLSQRAVIAFTSGAAEWIVYRFTSVCADPLPLQYLEATWAMIVDLRYCREVWEDYTNEMDWTGPVRGPIGIAMKRVMYAIQVASEDGDSALRAARISNLARYLMTNSQPYVQWRERIIKRLEEIFPKKTKDPWGEVVPRMALDSDFDFKVEQTESLVNQFLASLDYRTNPFLNPPEMILEQGFEGTPYVFDMEKDRKARLKE